MATPKTSYKITVDDEMSSQLRKMNDHLSEMSRGFKENSKHAKEANEHMEKFGERMKKAAEAIGLFEAGRKIFDLAKESLTEFTDSELALARLEGQLVSTGNAVGYTASELEALAEKTSKSSGIFDDKEIMNAEARMASFSNITGKTFKDALEASNNLALALKLDVADAAATVGKALQAPGEGLRALEKEGIRFTNAEKEQMKALAENNQFMEAQGMILDRLNEKFGKVAETVSETTAAAFGKMKLEWEDGLKGMGEQLSQFFKPQIQEITKFMKELNAQSVVSIYSGMSGEEGYKQSQALNKVLSVIGQFPTASVAAAKGGKQLEEALQSLSAVGIDPQKWLEAFNTQLPDFKEKMKKTFDLAQLWDPKYVPGGDTIKWANDLIAKLEKVAGVEDALFQNRQSQADRQAVNERSELDALSKRQEAERKAAEEERRALEKWRQERDLLKNKYEFLTEIEKVQADILKIEKMQREAQTPESKKILESAHAGARKKLSELVSAEIEANKSAVEKLVDELLEKDSQRIKNAQDLIRLAEKYQLTQEQILAVKKQLGEEEKLILGAYSKEIHYAELVKTGIERIWSELSASDGDFKQNQIDAQKNANDLWYQGEESKIKQAQANGQNTAQIEADLAAKKLQKDTQLAEAEAQLKRQQFEADKAAKIIQAEINTALAVTNALATIPPPAGFIEAAIIGAFGLAQAAFIAGEPTPQFLDGGIVFPSADPEGRLIRVAEREPEWILNGRQMDKILDRRESASSGGGLHISFDGATIYGNIDEDFAYKMALALDRVGYTGKLRR